jgi:hypothetical protein
MKRLILLLFRVTARLKAIPALLVAQCLDLSDQEWRDIP